jgi:predicted transcriptional regulator
MATLTVRIDPATHKVLQELAQQEGRSMPVILAKAIEQYRRRQFLEQVNAAYGTLRADAAAWDEELQERALWDKTLSDGLEEA